MQHLAQTHYKSTNFTLTHRETFCGGWNWLRDMTGLYLIEWTSPVFQTLLTETAPKAWATQSLICTTLKKKLTLSSPKPQTHHEAPMFYIWHLVFPVASAHNHWGFSFHSWLSLALVYWASLYAICFSNKEEKSHGLVLRGHNQQNQSCYVVLCPVHG